MVTINAGEQNQSASGDRHPSTPPEGPWVMVQRWHHLLFAHWRCRVSDLRALIPSPLEIETYEGDAYIGVIPFYMSGVRLRAAPPVPTAHAFEELNVRTYVTLDGRPGIWFFSLDCASSLAVIGARIGVYLPYYRAAMSMSCVAGAIDYESQRWPIGAAPAAFSASSRGVGPAAEPAPRSLDHFLTERYSLYTSSGTRIWRGDIWHRRWPLQGARAEIERNSMVSATGVRVVDEQPLLHYSDFQDVRFWWPDRVR
jgi:uncharacterized protein YqjF (DUF2071 family)